MSFYRNTVWTAKGNREFTRDGFLSAKKNFVAKELDVDCTDRVFVVTGANRGLGKAIATEIARRSGVVHLVCRSKLGAEESRKCIVETTGNPHVHVHVVDMSRPQQVFRFAEKFCEEQTQLSVVIHNAECMNSTREKTEEGLELSFSTNVLGVHILTAGVLPLLRRSVDPRVVMVSAGGMFLQRLNADDVQLERLEPWDDTVAFAHTKRMLVVLAQNYAVRHPEVHFSCANPGWVDTPGFQCAMKEFFERTKDRLRTVEEGADTVVWLAIAARVKDLPNGHFFQDRVSVSPHLPLAWTRTGKQEEEKFMEELDRLSAALCRHHSRIVAEDSGNLASSS